MNTFLQVLQVLLPPHQVEKNLSDVIDLVPELCEDLFDSVDQPLRIARDKTVGKDYLLCDYNRDGDSYRCVMSYCFFCVWRSFSKVIGQNAHSMPFYFDIR